MHRHSMISAFVVHCLDSIIPLLALAGISRPKLVSVAEQAGLSLNRSHTPKTGFLVTWLIYMSYEPPHAILEMDVLQQERITHESSTTYTIS